MIEQGLIKSHFVGRDGFIWWIGQVVDETQWTPNIPGVPTKTAKEQKGFDFRYKVRIMGYHTAAPTDLKDEELPWASVMLPVTAGVSGGSVSTPDLKQGDFVYGFFMDGEDAQMPIIMGVLGYNQYTAVMKNVPDASFLPFSGYRTKPVKTDEGVAEADHVPTSSNPTTQEKPDESAVAEGVDVSKTNNDKIAESSVGLIRRDDGASLEQFKNESIPLFIPSSSKCEQAPMVGIQRDIKNMINEIQRIKKTASDWETKVSTTLPKGIEAEIAKVKDNTNKAIADKVKKVVSEVQRNALKKVNSAVSDSYDKVFPTELPQINETVEDANDMLSCAFKNIMKNLTSMIGGFLDGATDRMINAPECAVTDFTGDMLGKISGVVDDVVDKAMKPIQFLVAGMGATTDAVTDVMGFTSDALSFLTCDEPPECSDVKEWNPVSGAEAPATLNLNELVNKARVAKEAFKAAAEAAGELVDLDNFNFNLDFSDTFAKLGVSAGGCNVGPRDCGPPIVEFIGGGGSGARGNAIVSAATTLIGVDIISAGSGYTSPPKIIFKDACNKGRGAVGRAVLGPIVPIETPGFVGDIAAGGNTINNVSNYNINTLIPGAEIAINSGGGTVTLGSGAIITDVTGNTVTINQTFGGTGAAAIVKFSIGTTGTTTSNFTGDMISGGNDITNVSDLTNIAPGVTITLGSGGGTVTLATGAVVTSVVGTTVTIDQAFGGTGSASSATFSGTTTRTTTGTTGTTTGTTGTTTGTTGTTTGTTTGINLGVAQVIIEDSGIDYLPSPDGSRGGNGTTWATPEETIVKRGGNFPGSGGIPGIYDTPHKPGEVVELYIGDEFTPPGGATEIITEDKSATCPPLPSTGRKSGVFPSSGSGEYPVVLEIETIHIADGGYGYDCSKDKVVIEPANGAQASIKCDPLGGIIGVDVINGGIGFNEEPILYIESDTGYNAKLRPVFKVNKVGSDIDTEAIALAGTIQVIDCVGKF